MVNRGITATAVALALLASVQAAVFSAAESSGECQPQKGIACYWEEAEEYGVDVLIPGRQNETEYLKHVCVSEQELPATAVCEEFYAGCEETEKLKFERQEKGYALLQVAVTNSAKCKGVSHLTKCIKEDVMTNCPVQFEKIPTHEHARQNHEAAVKLTKCLNDSLAACGQEYSNSTEYIQSIANALTLLYWHHETTPTPMPPTSELPSSTSVSTEAPTHETSPTSERTTEHPHPTERTTEEPVTATTPSISTEPATTSPTETPKPATTPKPSGAATSVPFVGTMALALALALAH